MSVRQKEPSAPPAQLAKPKTNSRRGRKLAKQGAALALVAVGVYAVMSDSVYVASNNAVVSAYVVSLRTPIDGFVDRGLSPVGTAVAAGSVLARIENRLIDMRRLNDLQAHQERLTTTLASLEREHQSLLALREALAQRSSAHQEAVTARLASRVLSVEGSLSAKMAEQDHLRHELARKLTLSRSGTVSPAELEVAQSAFDVAARELSALGSDLAAARVDADAAQHGVLSETGAGAMDVAYSTQRADELAMHLVEAAHNTAVLVAERDETARQIAAEEKRLALFRTADIVAPQHSMVWRLNVSSGERLGTGDLVAQLVDCQEAFVTVAVSQSRLSDVVVGSMAHLRLTGEATERFGRVLSVTGDPLVSSNRHLATSPVEERAPTALAIVEIDPSDNNSGACLVGRTARVLLPASGGGMFKRTIQRLPLLDDALNAIIASGPVLHQGLAWIRNQFGGSSPMRPVVMNGASTGGAFLAGRNPTDRMS